MAPLVDPDDVPTVPEEDLIGKTVETLALKEGLCLPDFLQWAPCLPERLQAANQDDVFDGPEACHAPPAGASNRWPDQICSHPVVERPRGDSSQVTDGRCVERLDHLCGHLAKLVLIPESMFRHTEATTDSLTAAVWRERKW